VNAAKSWIVTAALLGAAGVALGAYGAHGLEKRVVAVVVGESERAASEVRTTEQEKAIEKRMEDWKTATHYWMTHVAALLAIGLATARWPSRIWCAAGSAMLAGMAMFSGVLYYRSLSPDPQFGIVVMFGGLSYITGWLLLAIAALRIPRA
jgi:uncharacterized membrane protein YgdD (TMEM256/DUF423 family)